MFTALLGFLALLVFGVLWLVHHDAFEFLPRSTRRAVEAFAGVVLVGTCLLFPAAFRDGFTRFVDYRSGQIMKQFQDTFSRIGTSTPTTAPSARPTPKTSPKMPAPSQHP